MTSILGISAFYHDAAAALVVDGEIVAAAQEERFTRVKHDASFPINSIQYCLQHAGLSVEEIDHVVFYEKSFLKFERLLETYLSQAPRGWASFTKSMPVWLGSKLYLSRKIGKRLRELGSGRYQRRIIFPEHHESHAASAFFASPFDNAAILTVDGVGEWASTTLGVGRGNQIQLTDQISFPDSLGLLYSAFTSYCGFRVNGGEGKLMGLAPYGEPIYADLILGKLIDVKPDGSFRMNQSFFNYAAGNTMTSKTFESLFGGPARVPETEITDRQRDLAASIQLVTETVLLKIANHLHQQSKMENLCIAGGVGLNCVANGRLLRESKFENVWIQPAAGDSGAAIGAALFAWHQLLDNPRVAKPKQTLFLGPTASRESARASLAHLKEPFEEFGAVFEVIPNDNLLFEKVADYLDSQSVVGWHQGRMEFGPRALGNRSILADPRNSQMKDRVNKLKFRESFRPFAPAVLWDRVSDFFDLHSESPYMLLAAQLKEPDKEMNNEEQQRTRSPVAAVTHVDGSARIQTVDESDNPMLFGLLRQFEAKTGCPALLNTSFNLRGQPIVCSVEDSWLCFMNSDIDVLVVENCLLLKSDQPTAALAAAKQEFRHSRHTISPPRTGAPLEGLLRFNKRVQDFMLKLLFPFRYLISITVLTLVFLFCVTPLGIIWRLTGRKSLKPIDKPLATYWIERANGEAKNKSSYFKQY